VVVETDEVDADASVTAVVVAQRRRVSTKNVGRIVATTFSSCGYEIDHNPQTNTVAVSVATTADAAVADARKAPGLQKRPPGLFLGRKFYLVLHRPQLCFKELLLSQACPLGWVWPANTGNRTTEKMSSRKRPFSSTMYLPLGST
jgi:hypothetical protein